MDNCIFCQIAAQADPNIILYHDDQVTAFNDRHPRAPVHILVIPNKHFDSIKDITLKEEQLLGHMLAVAAILARENGLETNGFRLVINTGPDAGQSVFHLHLHLLGGRPMPMGFGGPAAG
jgi:histidine triad (HIT) family protein